MEPFNIRYFYYLLSVLILVSVLSITTYRPTEESKEKPNLVAEEVKAATGSFVPLYRYLGSSQKTGPNHFYTTSQDEIGTTILGQVGKDGYMSQGIAGHVYTAPQIVPLYRYYNGGIQDHFYTTVFGELACGAHGWKYEGIQAYCFRNFLPGINRPLYRYWNGKDHFYTTDPDVIGTTTLGITGNYGYKCEGIPCYVV